MRLAAFLLIFLATPVRANVSTGLHANEVEPLMRGVLAMSAQVMTYWGCFLALDDDDVCIRIADRARTTALR